MGHDRKKEGGNIPEGGQPADKTLVELEQEQEQEQEQEREQVRALDKAGNFLLTLLASRQL